MEKRDVPALVLIAQDFIGFGEMVAKGMGLESMGVDDIFLRLPGRSYQADYGPDDELRETARDALATALPRFAARRES